MKATVSNTVWAQVLAGSNPVPSDLYGKTGLRPVFLNCFLLVFLLYLFKLIIKKYMKKLSTIFLILLLSVFFAGCSKEKEKAKESFGSQDLNCQAVCAKASSLCPTIMPNEFCLQACPFWSDEQKQQFSQTKNCQEMAGLDGDEAESSNQEQEDNTQADQSDCELACSNYALKCLSSSEDTSQAAYNQKFFSCIQDCSGWKTSKAECVINALDCSSITNDCDL